MQTEAVRVLARGSDMGMNVTKTVPLRNGGHAHVHGGEAGTEAGIVARQSGGRAHARGIEAGTGTADEIGDVGLGRGEKYWSCEL
jgi:hypothetical protein